MLMTFPSSLSLRDDKDYPPRSLHTSYSRFIHTGHKISITNQKVDRSGASMPTLQMKKLSPQLALGRDLSSRKASEPWTRAQD